ncbi:hypothetical protein M501DRAFT_57730 [Patellaria atrata CBS 101060]|uniref:Uncharacterized protein n=1 Tax=Patellaria atrata CBS 101060 TaxID=1346257 RepID=A0A9P4VRM0_9PEZI|nr:hypothetical protein M501DRAFT_57730 [Patellaria atrata CBS 101060]
MLLSFYNSIVDVKTLDLPLLPIYYISRPSIKLRSIDCLSVVNWLRIVYVGMLKLSEPWYAILFFHNASFFAIVGMVSV